MKIKVLIFLAFVILLSACSAPADPMLDRLNMEISKRDSYKAEKENRIHRLEKQLSDHGLTDEKRMYIYEELYREYMTFQADSALNVVNRQYDFAVSTGYKEWEYLSGLHKIMLFASAGYFTELNNMLAALPVDEFSPQLKLEYYKCAEKAYNNMADFLNDDNLANEYWAKGSLYQDSVMMMLPAESPEYRYYKGNRMWNEPDVDNTILLFESLRESVGEDERLYAQTAYLLSCLYNRKADYEKQKDYLVRAAISDQKAQLKEGVALQELALFLRQNGGDKSLANHYLSLSMEDANFYGNKLRLLQTAYKYPKVVTAYEQQLVEANRRQKLTLAVIAVLTFLLCGVIVVLIISIRKIHRERRQIEIAGEELKAANSEVKSVNRQLVEANSQLKYQTHLRETCIALFIELTAAYINKLNQLNLTVRMKIKGNQVAELLKLVSAPGRMSDSEAREFFMSFDSAFLTTFPNFVDDVNALLKPDKRFEKSDSKMLSLDLRILALIRLGVKDSAKIASLLNCSPQTIYNHRSQIKSRTLSRETFEKDLMEI